MKLLLKFLQSNIHAHEISIFKFQILKYNFRAKINTPSPIFDNYV